MRLPELHPVDAESKLTEVFTRLKTEVSTHPNRNEKVGSFWDEEWHRAPFEEELTLKQLASLTFDALIKKKSFTAEKMVALAIALERGLSVKAIPNDRNIKLELTTDAEIAPRHREDAATNRYILLSDQYSVQDRITWLGLQATAEIALKNTSLFALATAVFNSGMQCSPVLWSKSSISLSHEDKKNVLDAAMKAAPEVLIHWRTALSGAGSSISTLVKPYGITDEQLQLAAILLLPLLQALEAYPLILNKKQIPHHYTLHSESAPAIFTALKGKNIKDEEKFISIFSLPFPFFDLPQVFATLRKTKISR